MTRPQLAERAAVTSPAVRSRIAPLLLAHLPAEVAEQLHRRFGLDRDELAAGALVLPLDRFRALCEEAALAAGDESLGLRVGSEQTRGSFGLVEFVFRSAPTVGAALEQLVQCAPLINSALSFSVERSGDQLIVASRIYGEPRCLGRQANEFSLAHLTMLGREITGTAFAARDVWFAHSRPADISPLVTYFDTERITFDAGANALVVDAALLAARVPSADHALHRVLDVQARDVIADSRDELSPVRDAIRDLLHAGEPSIARVARRLAVSTRTLQRRLNEHGTTFRALYDDVRRALAQRYVVDDARPLADIASVLGYSDSRALARAFKRWTGVPPNVVRRASGRD